LFAYGAESVTNQAYWLGHTELFDSYRWFDNYLDNLAAVTVADVQRVAQKYLARANRTVGHFVPDPNGSQMAEAGSAMDELEGE
jgi:zinc protease